MAHERQTYAQGVLAADGPVLDESATLRRRAGQARDRAALSGARAAYHDAVVVTADEERRRRHEQVRDLYRRVEASHRMSAELHDLLAARMEERNSRPGRGSALPAVMQVVAARLRASSAVAALSGRHMPAALVAASDATARRAHELELVMAEGPATEARRGSFVMAAGPVLIDRWPRYGPAVADLGIHAVCAAPLGPPDAVLGALCAYDREALPVPGQAAATATRLMAGVLTQILLGVADPANSDGQLRILDHLDGSDWQAIVHQAAGMVSVQCDCGVDDALDLLAARAFAEARPVREIAVEIIHGTTVLR